MSESDEPTGAGWETHRVRQHREFLALTLREKLTVLEQLAEVAEHFAARRRARGLPVAGQHAGDAASPSR